MSGTRHDEASPALIAGGGPYAKRMKIWTGYAEPTAEELSALRVRLANPLPSIRGYWNRRSDDWVVRQIQLIELADIRRWGREAHTAAYGWTLALMREMNRRGLTRTSVRLLRCEVCAHGTERLWEATPDTHMIENRSGEICTAFVCAQCWSRCLNEEEED